VSFCWKLCEVTVFCHNSVSRHT